MARTFNTIPGIPGTDTPCSLLAILVSLSSRYGDLRTLVFPVTERLNECRPLTVIERLFRGGISVNEAFKLIYELEDRFEYDGLTIDRSFRITECGEAGRFFTFYIWSSDGTELGVIISDVLHNWRPRTTAPAEVRRQWWRWKK